MQKTKTGTATRRKETYRPYISIVSPEEKLMMYDFYDKMDSTNTIDHLENLKRNIMKTGWWKRLIVVWDNASLHVSRSKEGSVPESK